LANVKEQYDFDTRDGIIVNKRFGLRSFMLGVREWNSLIERLHDTFGTAAETILFEAGKSYGGSILEEEREILDPTNQLTLNLLSRDATLAGWGKITIEQISPKEYTIKNQRCVFCSGSNKPEHKEVGCFFLMGVIAGFAKMLFHWRTQVKETRCGKDYCEFKVTLNA
jgi:predicted hydrocarbon binding protein